MKVTLGSSSTSTIAEHTDKKLAAKTSEITGIKTLQKLHILDYLVILKIPHILTVTQSKSWSRLKIQSGSKSSYPFESPYTYSPLLLKQAIHNPIFHTTRKLT